MSRFNASVWALVGAAGLAGAAAAEHPRYTVTVLLEPDGSSANFGVQAFNDQGDVVVGHRNMPTPNDVFRYVTVVWRDGQGTTVLPDPPGRPNSLAVEINNEGVIVGNASTTFVGEWAAVGWYYQGGQYTFVPEFVPGRGMHIHDLNHAGVSCGDGNDGRFVGAEAFRFLPDGSAEQLFPEEPENYNWWAEAINNSGQILATGVPGAFILDPQTDERFVLPPPSSTYPIADVYDLNDLMDVSGSARVAGHAEGTRAFVYLHGSGPRILPPSGRRNTAVKINNERTVIGNSQDNTGARGDHGWVWTERDGLAPLDELLAPGFEGLAIGLVRDINEDGQILAGGFVRETGEGFGMILTPIPPTSTCPADFNGDAFVNPDDLSDYITCFFLDVQFPATCPESDFNADGFRNPDDLSDFITGFFSGCQ
jgi:uncharacterized membrane protein